MIKKILDTYLNKTEFGNIPEEWNVLMMENVAEIRGRIGWRGMTTNDYRIEGPILLGVTNISKDFKLKLDSITRISEERYKESPEIMVKEKDILLAKSGATTGKVCYVQYLRERATVNAAVNIIRSNESIVFPEFLYYFLSWGVIQKKLFQKSSAGAQPNLFQRDTKKISIILPSLIEQQKIASILSNVDSLIQKTDQIIEQTRILKKGLMQRLLTKGIGHTKFKKTELGDIPEVWDQSLLLDFVEGKNDIVAGPFGSNLKVSDYKNDGVPIIRLQNIERNEFVNKNIKYISKEKAYELKYHSYKPHDIVLAKLGDPIGKTCIVPEYVKGGIVVADVVRIRPSLKKTDTRFLEYALNSEYCSKQMNGSFIGTTRPRVNLDQIRYLTLLKPPLKEQQKIASILSNVDELIKQQQDNKTNLEILKKGLMQQLLTGKIRVKV